MTPKGHCSVNTHASCGFGWLGTGLEVLGVTLYYLLPIMQRLLKQNYTRRSFTPNFSAGKITGKRREFSPPAGNFPLRFFEEKALYAPLAQFARRGYFKGVGKKRFYISGQFPQPHYPIHIGVFGKIGDVYFSYIQPE